MVLEQDCEGLKEVTGRIQRWVLWHNGGGMVVLVTVTSHLSMRAPTNTDSGVVGVLTWWTDMLIGGVGILSDLSTPGKLAR